MLTSEIRDRFAMAAKAKVLVVNDEPSIQKYLRTLLEVHGFDVAAVKGGTQALAKINAGERPDCIILDLMMPEMNGLETLEEMMRLDPRLNVVMTSCWAGFGTIVEAIRLGAREYLVFPFENAELIRAMLGPRRKRQKQNTFCVTREISPLSLAEQAQLWATSNL